MTDPAFPLISDLSAADQAELLRIQAIPSAFRTAKETAYFNARLPYTQNFILSNLIKKGSPTPNGLAAIAGFFLTGNVANTETVTIGTDVYEFRTSGSAAAGHIKVDVSGGADSASAITALAAAIPSGLQPVNINSSSPSGGELDIQANAIGPSGDFITVSTTCANGAWKSIYGDEPPVTTLVGGQFAVLANQVDLYFATSNKSLWIATDNITSNSDTTNWVQITIP